MSLKHSLIADSKRIHILKYVLLPSIALLVIVFLSTIPNLWTISAIDHYYIELFGTILAGILAFYYLSRSHNLKEKFSLFIGIGFLINVLIDLLHVTVSFLNIDDILFLKYFIPQTWFAGRLFLSAMLAIVMIKYVSLSYDNPDIQKIKQKQTPSNQNHVNKISKKFLLYLIILASFSLIVAISSLFLVFPFSVVDDIPIHRPYELFPLALLLISLYYFYKNEIYKNKDVLYASILLSIVLDIFGQIIMSYSAYYFDTPHGIAHVLKDIGYFINVIGLVLSNIQYNKELRESNIRLREGNELLHQQNEKIKESEKMKEEFINIAAHVLRTPIQPIIGLVDNIYSNSKNEQQKEVIEIIMRNAERLKRLTDNLLDVTKIESGSLMIKKEKLNLNILISEVLKDYHTNKKIKQQMVKIVYDFKQRDDITIETDKDRLSQVITNLLDNALKFTESGQLIFVCIDKKKNDDEVIVSIKDAGQGISKDVLPKLFSKFTTGDSSSGTGLGLYICKNIVEAHGGKIWAENSSDGKGAIFRFALPIAD